MRTLKTSIINAWAEELEKDLDAFLDFAEGLHISESCTQGGERVLYFEDGMYYLGRGGAFFGGSYPGAINRGYNNIK